ncbi:MAG: tRNA lysidine(34) synthetase TilS [Chloroflexi bacterium]|nr:tRNA lysidine(34) synthetase TilS [Chloroflexota bacterium]
MTLPSNRRIRDIGRRISRSLVEHVGTGFGRPLIAAVSAGADSSAMLLLLADTQSRHGWRVRAAHVDHLIQSEEIRQQFREGAVTLSEQAGAPLDIVEADARAESERASSGIEAAARRVRYDALSRLAEDRGAPVVSAAHTEDDQAETVLLHILRGSGLDGLSGMPAQRPLTDEVQLVRPLLGVTRQETVDVCRAYDWQPVPDPSNEHLEHTRNRIRHSLLPLMSEINPGVSERLAQLSRAVSSDRELLELIGQETLTQLRDASGAIARRQFLTLPGPLQTRVLRALCREHGLILSAERTAAALQVIHTGHGRVELPGGAQISVAGGTISVAQPCPPPVSDC